MKNTKKWSHTVDCKYKDYKHQIFDNDFQQFIIKNPLLILSLNYTNLIEIVYNIKDQNLLKLHDFGKLAYLDSNNTYDISEKRQAKFGLPSISDIPYPRKQAVGISILREYLYNYLIKDSETINIYIYGTQLKGIDFCYLEEIFKTCKYIQSFNIYIKKHPKAEEDKSILLDSLDSFFSYKNLQNEGIKHLMLSDINFYEDTKKSDDEWIAITGCLYSKYF